MQITVGRTGGCFGIPSSFTIDTSNPTSGLDPVAIAAIERAARAVMAEGAPPIGHWGTMPVSTVSIVDGASQFTGRFPGMGSPAVETLRRLVETHGANGVQRPGGYFLG